MIGRLADPLLTGLLVARLAVVVLGAVVAARGLRGYRRTGNRLMLALGVAFALVTANPLAAAAAGAVLDAATTGVVGQVTTLVLYGTAFSLVLLGLYWRPDSRAAEHDSSERGV